MLCPNPVHSADGFKAQQVIRAFKNYWVAPWLSDIIGVGFV